MSYQQEEVSTPGGVRFRLLKGGAGSPVLFLHAIIGDFEWGPFLQELARNHTVFAPLQPGFDDPDKMEGIDGVEDLVFHYGELMHALGLARAAVVGVSVGGWIAAELAVQHPHLVSRLVLMDALGLYVAGASRSDIFAANLTRARQILFGEPESDVARRWAPDAPDEAALGRILNWRHATSRIGWNPYLHNPKLAHRLYRIAMPTLVVWGARDKLVDLAHGQAFVKGMPDARLTVIEGAGHLPHLEAPEQAAKAVSKFLKD